MLSNEDEYTVDFLTRCVLATFAHIEDEYTVDFLTCCVLATCAHIFCLLIFYSKLIFLKHSFRNTFRM